MFWGNDECRFAKAKQNGMKYFIVEQERYDNTTPLKAVEADADYMKTLKQ